MLVNHYHGIIRSTMASQITSLTIVYSTVYSGTDQRKHQIPASLAFVRGIRRWPVNSPQMASNAEKVSIWWRHHGRPLSHNTRGRGPIQCFITIYYGLLPIISMLCEFTLMSHYAFFAGPVTQPANPSLKIGSFRDASPIPDGGKEAVALTAARAHICWHCDAFVPSWINREYISSVGMSGFSTCPISIFYKKQSTTQRLRYCVCENVIFQNTHVFHSIMLV